MPVAPRQQWDPGAYGRNARFVSDLGQPLLELLNPQPGERILDLGCGDGALTASAAGAWAPRWWGVDSSGEMVHGARAQGIDARVGDGQRQAEALAGEAPFDAVFSNAALHWMSDSRAVLRGVHGLLQPGGRFVGEFGGKGNVAAITAALEGVLARRGIEADSPWFFPDAPSFTTLLEEADFEVEELALFPRPTPPAGGRGWLAQNLRPALHPSPAQRRAGGLPHRAGGGTGTNAS
jgi:SAM-dependent methyltransferase